VSKSQGNSNSSYWGLITDLGRHFHDPAYKEKVLNATSGFDLTELCSGWLATYEVWALQPESIRLASAQISIPPREMLIPIRSYLYYRYSTEINLPMAISAEVDAFSILETLFSIDSKANRSRPRCLRCILPMREPASRDFFWAALTSPCDQRRQAIYSVAFSKNKKDLAVLEWDNSGEQHITVYRYEHTYDLRLLERGTILLQFGIRKVARVLFHPNREILAFCAHSTRGTPWQNAAFIWAYGKGT